MEKRRDQPTRTEAKTRLLVRVNLCLSSGDYARALDLLRGAAGEFVNDAELSALEKLAQDGIKRKTEADRLITESQELFAQQNSVKAIELLRQAYGLDKSNSLARSILANALVEHAHSIVETDWWEAETVANEALALNPAHPTAKTIQSLVLEQKMAGSVDEWVSQTNKLQSAGNLSAALSQVAEGLSVFPHETRLLQVQDAIQRDYATQRRQARRRDLEDLRRAASEVDGVTDAGSKTALAERIRALTVKYSTDGEILSIANALLLRFGHLGVAQRSAAAAATSEAATAVHRAPPPSAAELVAAIPFAPKPISVRSGPIGMASPRVISPRIAPPNIVPADKAPARVEPPVKLLSIAAESQLEPPRTAAVPAVEPLATTVTVVAPPSETKPVKKTNSKALITGSAAAIIVVAAISFFAGKRQALPVTKSSAAAPTSELQSDPARKGSGLHTSESAGGVSAPSLSASVAATSTVTASVPTNPEPPPPTSRTSVKKAATNPAPNVVADVAPKDQLVAKPAPTTPQQKIPVRNGEAARTFNLPPRSEPQPHLASLTIHGGAPGTAVFVDQAVVGTIQPDGTLSVSTINAGDHAVELRKERFKSREFKKHFDLGGVVSLGAADTALDPVPAELRITFAPADAKVAIVKGDLLTMVSSGVPPNLAPGTYTLTARTAERFTRSSTLEVVAGQSRSLDLSLAPNDMSKWDDPGSWKKEGESFVRKGGDFVLYGVAPVSGTFVFSAMTSKGRQLQWVVNYIDTKNYTLYQMDDDNFYRTVVRNGARTDEIKIPDKGDTKSFREFHIRVSPTEIVHQIRHGNSWTVLDRWTQTGANLGVGKFGFYLPGNDKIAVSGFAYYADLNIH